MLKKYIGTGKGLVKAFKEDFDCCENKKNCKYSVTTDKIYKGFIYTDENGDEQTVSIAAGLTDVDDIKASLIAEFDKLGYKEQISESDGYGYKESVSVTKDGANYTFVIYSQLPLKSLKTTTTDVTLTSACTVAKVCEGSFEVAYDTDPGKIAYDGGAGTAVGSDPWFAAGDAAAVKTAFEAALTTETISYYSVTATDTGSDYLVKVAVYGDCSKLTLEGVASEQCRTFPDFK